MRWGSNNYHHDHPLFAEYINSRLGSTTDANERDHLVKEWENVMIHDLDPLRRHAKNTSFGDGEVYGDLQLEFNMWVCHFPWTMMFLFNAWFSGTKLNTVHASRDSRITACSVCVKPICEWKIWKQI